MYGTDIELISEKRAHLLRPDLMQFYLGILKKKLLKEKDST